ncbi:MAG: hypothetical protein HY842_05255 [Bacteroidetes bacterium]|nr:hypothetical protein [Bacteroidota bacterium]
MDKNTAFSQKFSNSGYSSPECNPVEAKNHPVWLISSQAWDVRLLLLLNFAFQNFVPKENSCTVLAGKIISHEVFRKTIVLLAAFEVIEVIPDYVLLLP